MSVEALASIRNVAQSGMVGVLTKPINMCLQRTSKKPALDVLHILLVKLRRRAARGDGAGGPLTSLDTPGVIKAAKWAAG